ncbi:MAG: hypothetical protein ACI8RD_011210 [Bacillariaceae sp.]|jgi:hypothetical protein
MGYEEQAKQLEMGEDGWRKKRRNKTRGVEEERRKEEDHKV